MSDRNKRSEELPMNAVAFLQEFYNTGIIEQFCTACRDYGCNVADAVITLKYLLMQNLALEQVYPDFPDLAEMYARRMDLDIQEFSQHFYIQRRDNQQ